MTFIYFITDGRALSIIPNQLQRMGCSLQEDFPAEKKKTGPQHGWHGDRDHYGCRYRCGLDICFPENEKTGVTRITIRINKKFANRTD